MRYVTFLTFFIVFYFCILHYHAFPNTFPCLAHAHINFFTRNFKIPYNILLPTEKYLQN